MKALLIDLDGVLRLWDADTAAAAEKQCSLPAGAITAAAFSSDLLVPAVLGRVADEDWRRLSVQRLLRDFPDSNAERAIALWSEASGRIDSSVLQIVRDCRRSSKVVLVTNATTRLGRDLEELHLLADFDHIVNSAVVGFMKPNRKIFEEALRVAETAAADAVFFDDNGKHVTSASNLGIASHIFVGADDMRGRLSALGMLSL
jgi:putative hydrolase of the HAD superfamily